jgi:hypothetical protein
MSSSFILLRLTGLISYDLMAINLPTPRASRFELPVRGGSEDANGLIGCKIAGAHSIAGSITINTSPQKRLPPALTH